MENRRSLIKRIDLSHPTENSKPVLITQIVKHFICRITDTPSQPTGKALMMLLSLRCWRRPKLTLDFLIARRLLFSHFSSIHEFQFATLFYPLSCYLKRTIR
ncbi:hypothetical protein [Shimazuella alba]|uniref:Uncharacterized protein n=1 Tax=Shimazuella alba TaxID=2690964 RepID=A0A6I4VSZ3_9BACL|nr:hypothetical protein [Shimazuella alba]MXQ53561.1 hypothetical protein [Shimazuella alba]